MVTEVVPPWPFVRYSRDKTSNAQLERLNHPGFLGTRVQKRMEW